MTAPFTGTPTAAPSSRAAELENSRLGVIYFLGNLRVDFSPEESASSLMSKGIGILEGKAAGSKVGGKIVAVAKKAGGAVDALDKGVDQIAASIQKWLVDKFNFSSSDAELAIQHVRYNLPPLIYGIQDEARKTADDFGVTGIASGLYTGISKTIEYFDLRHTGKGVALESGHPDIVAASIQKSVAKSALVGLAEAALAGAKAALAAFTAGAGLIVNKVAGVIELILRFCVRFCDALSLRKIFADAKDKWTSHMQTDALQKRAGDFADWFKKTIDRAPVVAALIMNCGIAGDAMRFLQVATSDGVVLTQGQFDKGVTYLNALKSSASDLIMECQKEMRISSKNDICAALLKHSEQIGLVQKEAKSSWRARVFGWTHQDGAKSKALNWVLEKAGYKQSTPMTRRA
jgi:hypothetical protein